MKKLFLLMATAVISVQCGIRHKVNDISGSDVTVDISLPHESVPRHSEDIIDNEPEEAVENVEDSGPVIMNAIKDEDGEMVATDVIRAAVVSARFRNVAERMGKVDLKFQVTVPQMMQDSRWQLRMIPRLYIMEDSTDLEPVIITGSGYRRKQLRGYEQYRKFLESIISDPDKFINEHQLEMFLKRNIPEIYKFREDSSYVSDEEFASFYGVTEKAAVEHYTRKYQVHANDRRIARKDKMFSRYVKAPIETEGIRIDTVLQESSGDFTYLYTQTVVARPGLKKAEIRMSGNIMEDGKSIYRIPYGEPLTFYISSLSTLADKSVRYLKIITPRRVEANTACYVDFPSGSSEILPGLSNNASEISRIKGNLADLATDANFDLDSIIVAASSSPEGSLKYNSALSSRRAMSISGYFNKFLEHCRDSARREKGVMMSIGEDLAIDDAPPPVKFISKSNGEDWRMLDTLIARDSVMSREGKEMYWKLRKEPDPDLRENRMRNMSDYRYIRESLYPRLRTVKFNFFLHRKGMVEDTVISTVIDTVYMAGVKAIEDRDYKKAITLLKPYGDYNLAIAYCSMGYNASAEDILRRLPESDKTDYMLALVLSRTGREKEAVRLYYRACEKNPALVHRGNLDPEISALTDKYGNTH